LKEYVDMNTIRILAICALAMFQGHVWAQDKPVRSGTEPSLQDVGGVADSSRGETGVAMTPVRHPAYQDLGQSAQSGEQSRMGNNTFLHH
jgi:hypothetical protein